MEKRHRPVFRVIWTNGKNSILYWNRWHFWWNTFTFWTFCRPPLGEQNIKITQLHIERWKNFISWLILSTPLLHRFMCFCSFFIPFLESGMFCRSFNKTVFVCSFLSGDFFEFEIKITVTIRPLLIYRIFWGISKVYNQKQYTTLRAIVANIAGIQINVGKWNHTIERNLNCLVVIALASLEKVNQN